MSTVDPFRRPPMVDIPAEQVESLWQRWTQRLAESSLWRGAKTFADLCELSAQFCEGKLSRTPDHGGPRCEETERIAEPLAHANRKGFLTIGSQPGEDAPLYYEGELRGFGQQRAAVEGWAHPDTAERLQRLFAGTRIQVRVSQRRKWRADYSQVTNVSRYVPSEGDVREETHFGFVPAETTHFIDLGRQDLTSGAAYVTLIDPEWGDHDLLWRRLSAPDWDNPPPPDEDQPMPTNIPAGREHLWRRQAEADAEVKRLTALYDKATRRADQLNQRYPAYSPQVREADAEAERLDTEVTRAEAVAERVHQERTKGLSSWIDESPYLPICPDCGGSGGPVAGDAHDACPTCRGWGRKDDGTPTPPVWHEGSKQWINPATGQTVDPPSYAGAPHKDPGKPQAWQFPKQGHSAGYQGPNKSDGRFAAELKNPGTSSSGGTTMSGSDTYGGLRARVQGVASRMQERQGLLQQALGDTEQDVAEVNDIGSETTQAGIQDGLGALQQAQQKIEEAIQMVGAAEQSIEGAAAALS